uniref:acyl-CoA 6-desaturase-like n=1 Tax=Panthera onca TaxID=9690 RepID=UPI0029537CB4|nr:acyl-CoA 6-desaturase-like [Panthera onca]
MGKGGNQGGGATEREAPMPTFSWEEIQKHNLRTDKWLVIDRKVYNITKWSSRHPGGQRVIGHYAGEDATDAFRAFHRDLDFVHKFMKPLLIGELAPEEPGQDHGKNVSVPRPRKEGRVCGERGRCSPQDRECRGGPRELYVSAEEPLPNIWGQRAPRGSAVSPLLSLPAWAGPLPSSNSFPTSSPPGSQSSHLCLVRRVRGCGHTCGQDAAPGRTAVPHLILFSVQDLAWAVSYYARFLLTYSPFYGILGAVLFLNFIRFLESHWFVWVTQMNHIVMEIDCEPYRDWFSSQLAATCNVEQSLFNDWFSGHLNFQIEHHLFPTMPRHNFHKVAPLVKSLCAKHGIKYQEKPLLRALQDIIRSLKKSGQLWLDAYLHK